MIEVEEVEREKEEPTEVDIRLLFNDLKKPMKALQAMFAAELEKLEKDCVDVSNAVLTIESGDLFVTLGKQRLLYRETEEVWKSAT